MAVHPPSHPALPGTRPRRSPTRGLRLGRPARPYSHRMSGRTSKAQNMTVSRPFSRRWATVSALPPVTSTVPGGCRRTPSRRDGPIPTGSRAASRVPHFLHGCDDGWTRGRDPGPHGVQFCTPYISRGGRAGVPYGAWRGSRPGRAWSRKSVPDEPTRIHAEVITSQRVRAGDKAPALDDYQWVWRQTHYFLPLRPFLGSGCGSSWGSSAVASCGSSASSGFSSARAAASGSLAARPRSSARRCAAGGHCTPATGRSGRADPAGAVGGRAGGNEQGRLRLPSCRPISSEVTSRPTPILVPTVSGVNPTSRESVGELDGLTDSRTGCGPITSSGVL